MVLVFSVGTEGQKGQKLLNTPRHPLTSANSFIKTIPMKKAAKKRGKGRPKKAMQMKAIVVAVSLYDAENRKLEAMAAKRGESKSEVVRRLIREAR